MSKPVSLVDCEPLSRSAATFHCDFKYEKKTDTLSATPGYRREHQGPQAAFKALQLKNPDMTDEQWARVTETTVFQNFLNNWDAVNDECLKIPTQDELLAAVPKDAPLPPVVTVVAGGNALTSTSLPPSPGKVRREAAPQVDVVPAQYRPR